MADDVRHTTERTQVTDERLAAWKADAEWAQRHGKQEDGVPPAVTLALIAEVERLRTSSEIHGLRAAVERLAETYDNWSMEAWLAPDAAAWRLRKLLEAHPVNPPAEEVDRG